MMGYLHKYRLEIFILVFVTIAYFALRLYHIMNLPIFTDEAIYTRWSQIGGSDTNWRFIALTDGKQPLFTWFDMIFMRFIQDPLLSGRLVSVFAGFATMLGLFFLGKEVFKNKYVGLVSAFVYVIYPFGLVYDRMALYDSLVGTFTVWGLFVAILLIRYIRSDLGFTLGLLAGLGTLNKSSGFATVYFLPFTIILFDFKQKNWKTQFFHWACFAALAVALTYACYSILRLSPFFYIIDQKNATFIYPLKEWLHHPFKFFIGNMRGLLDWFISYITWPFITLIISSFFISKKLIKEKILLLLWFAVPLVLAALDGKVLYPRYILFMTLSLIPLIAYSIVWIYQKTRNVALTGILIVLFSTLPFYSDYGVLFDFPHATIAKPDLGQYVNDWPAGGGVNEMINFFRQESAKGKLYVASEGTFGSVPTLSIEIYLDKDPNIQKRGIWPITANMPQDLLEKAKKMPVYFVFEQTQSPPILWTKYLRPITKYQKGIGNSYMSIYQVIP